MPKSGHTPETPEPAVTRYASFIVRCWQDSEMHLRARLVDVNSGASYPIANLSDLPAVLRRLLRSIFLSSESYDSNSNIEKGER
ncbi:MAG: hypothetical protein JXA21_08910 [Anaerolineae bacterium]|nr:hypothetical protein [Anaerolineae bacterium]